MHFHKILCNDLIKGTLNKTEKYYMEWVENEMKKNLSQKKKKTFKANVMGITLGVSAVAIYFRTIFSVRQETFLDDDKPITE
ncbi:unnamed protein product [Gordionus sp. m RMFG-2023]